MILDALLAVAKVELEALQMGLRWGESPGQVLPLPRARVQMKGFLLCVAYRDDKGKYPVARACEADRGALRVAFHKSSGSQSGSLVGRAACNKKLLSSAPSAVRAR